MGRSVSAWLAFSIAAAVSVRPARADIYVSTTGSDLNSCVTPSSPCTLNQAFPAVPGQTVRIAAGRYELHAAVAGVSVHLSGGWNADFTSRDPRRTPTILRRGRSTDPILLLAENGNGTSEVTLDGLTFISGGGSALGLQATIGSHQTVHLVDVDFQRSRGDELFSAVDLDCAGAATMAVDMTGCRVLANKRKRISSTTDGHSGLEVTARDSGVVTLSVVNGVFQKNVERTSPTIQAPPGAAIALRASGGAALHASVVNTTVVGNRGPTAAGIYVESADTAAVDVALTNTIAFGNDAAGAPGADLTAVQLAASTLTLSEDHCDIGAQAVTGTTATDLGGNVSVDPQLQSTRDVHLRATSPLRDVGTNTGAPAFDFEGDPRPVDGDAVPGAVTDIGADEFVP